MAVDNRNAVEKFLGYNPDAGFMESGSGSRIFANMMYAPLGVLDFAQQVAEPENRNPYGLVANVMGKQSFGDAMSGIGNKLTNRLTDKYNKLENKLTGFGNKLGNLGFGNPLGINNSDFGSSSPYATNMQGGLGGNDGFFGTGFGVTNPTGMALDEIGSGYGGYDTPSWTGAGLDAWDMANSDYGDYGGDYGGDTGFGGFDYSGGDDGEYD